MKIKISKKGILLLLLVILISFLFYIYFYTKTKYIVCSKYNEPQLFSWDNKYIYDYKNLNLNEEFITYEIREINSKKIIGITIKKSSGVLEYILDSIYIDRIEGEILLGSSYGKKDYREIEFKDPPIYYQCKKVSKKELIKKPKF